MSRERIISRSLFIAAWSGVLMAGIFCRPAFGYIDPGTSQAVWTSLAPLVGIVVACLAIALIPIRFLISRVRSVWARRPRGKKAAAVWGAVIILAAAVGTGVVVFGKKDEGRGAAGEARRGGYKRVLVLGIDGLDPGIVERMMDAGELPNFAKLGKEGTFARLQTSVPAESPVAWTCAATGVNPGRHGIFDFTRRDPETYLSYDATLRLQEESLANLSGRLFARVIATPTFWEIASAAGKKVSVIRWPITFPPQKVNGHLLSGLGTPDVGRTYGAYRVYTTAALKEDGGESSRQVETVEWEGDEITAELHGPLLFTLKGMAAGKKPFRIEKGGSDSIRIELEEGKPFQLRTGEWSAWRPVEFDGGAPARFLEMSFPPTVKFFSPAIVKFYLESVTPELTLYASPAHIDPEAPAYAVSYPEGFSAQLAKEIGEYGTLGLPEEAKGVLDGRLSLSGFLKLCNDITGERERMFERELKQFDSGLLAVVFDASDRIQHIFWAATDPKHPAYTAELARQYGGVIADHYKRMDGVVGRALAAGSRGDMAIVVMSDHGFAGYRRDVNLNAWLAQKGYMVLKEGGTAEEAVWFKNVDWTRTRAYAVGFCSLFLNVQGREGQGIVAPGGEYRRVREELAQALRDLRDPATGAQVVRNVYPKEEVYRGPYLDEAPDLIVGYAPGYGGSARTSLGATPAADPVLVNMDRWSAGHGIDASWVPGIFMSNLKCNVSNPRVVDIAPTALKLLGLLPPPDLDGQPLL